MCVVHVHAAKLSKDRLVDDSQQLIFDQAIDDNLNPK